MQQKWPWNQIRPMLAHQISCLAVLLSTVINSEGEQTTSEDQSTRDGATQDHNLTFQWQQLRSCMGDISHCTLLYKRLNVTEVNMRPNPYTELERLQISVWPFQRHWSCYFHYIETVPIHWNLSIYNCHHGTTGDCLFRSFSIGVVQLGPGAVAIIKWWLPLTVTTMNRFHSILVLTGSTGFLSWDQFSRDQSVDLMRVDLMRVDLVAIDLVRIDLVTPSPPTYLDLVQWWTQWL